MIRIIILSEPSGGFKAILTDGHALRETLTAQQAAAIAADASTAVRALLQPRLKITGKRRKSDTPPA